jgi:hypothetical protein
MKIMRFIMICEYRCNISCNRLMQLKTEYNGITSLKQETAEEDQRFVCFLPLFVLRRVFLRSFGRRFSHDSINDHDSV